MLTRKAKPAKHGGVVSSREGTEMRPDTSTCAACDTGDVVTIYCQNCGEHFCDECAKFHRRHRSTKDHTLVDVTVCAGSAEVVVAECELHMQELVFFCKTCVVGICDECKTGHDKSHQVLPLSECAVDTKETYDEKLLSFQEKLKVAKEKQNGYQQIMSNFENQCLTVETEMVQRRSHIEILIQQILNEKIEQLRVQKEQMSMVFNETKPELEQMILQCEKVTPVSFEQDVQSQIEQIQLIDKESKPLIEILNKIARVETLGSVHIDDGQDTMKLIEQILRKHLNFKGCQSTQGSDISKLLTNVNISSATLAFVCKTKLPNYIRMSRNVYPDELLHLTASDRAVGIGALSADGTNFDRKVTNFPKALDEHNTNILTITKSRHVIISRDEIHLCNESDVIHSEPHTNDGYFPDQIAYVDEDKFVTLCYNKRMIRYHCAHTLACLDTHKLRSQDGAHIGHCFPIIFYAGPSNNTLLLSIKHKKFCEFTMDGIEKAHNTVSFHEDLQNCEPGSFCIGRGNKIFGVNAKYNRVHMFSLNGDHMVTDMPDETEYVWSTGTDDNYLYVSYSNEDDNGSDCIAKFTYPN